MNKELEKKCEELAFVCYTELCPHAPRVDKSVEPNVRWPVSKSTTMQGYTQGFRAAMELKLEAVDDLVLAAKAGAKLFDIMIEKKIIELKEPGLLFMPNEFEETLQNYERFKDE